MYRPSEARATTHLAVGAQAREDQVQEVPVHLLVHLAEILVLPLLLVAADHLARTITVLQHHLLLQHQVVLLVAIVLLDLATIREGVAHQHLQPRVDLIITGLRPHRLHLLRVDQTITGLQRHQLRADQIITGLRPHQLRANRIITDLRPLQLRLGQLDQDTILQVAEAEPLLLQPQIVRITTDQELLHSRTTIDLLIPLVARLDRDIILQARDPLPRQVAPTTIDQALRRSRVTQTVVQLDLDTILPERATRMDPSLDLLQDTAHLVRLGHAIILQEITTRTAQQVQDG